MRAISPAAVMSEMPGMEVRISARRSRASTSLSRCRISASMSFSWRSICFSLCLVSRPPTGVRKCLPRLVVATRSLSSASRICWSSARSRCPSDLALSRTQVLDGRRHGGQHPGVHGIGLGAPAEGAGEGPDLEGIDRVEGKPGPQEGILEVAVEGSGGFVRDPVDFGADPGDQLAEAGRAIREPGCSPLGRGEGVEPVLGDCRSRWCEGCCSSVLPFSCACHASLDAHVSIQDVGKDDGDQTPNTAPLRPSDPAVRPPSLLGARSGSLRSPPREPNSPGLPRDPDLQIKRTYPRIEKTSDPPSRGLGTGAGPLRVFTRWPRPLGVAPEPSVPRGKAIERRWRRCRCGGQPSAHRQGGAGSTRNSNVSLRTGGAVDARTISMADATLPCGNARMCCTTRRLRDRHLADAREGVPLEGRHPVPSVLLTAPTGLLLLQDTHGGFSKARHAPGAALLWERVTGGSGEPGSRAVEMGTIFLSSPTGRWPSRVGRLTE